MIRTGRTASTDGIEIAFSEWGNPSGPEVLLVHGWIFSRLAFSRQMYGELAERCRVVAYDLRGHGESAIPTDPGAYSNGRLCADDLHSVLDAVGLRRPILAGWSLGGRVVAHYVFVYGLGRVAGVNLVSSRILQDPTAVRGPNSVGSGIASDSLAERVSETARFVRNCSAQPLAADDFEHLFGAAMAVPTVARLGASAWHREYGDFFDHLELPVLVTHGARDSMVLPAAATRIAEKMRGSLSIYENCGHMPFWEDAARFNRELADLGARHWQPAGPAGERGA